MTRHLLAITAAVAAAATAPAQQPLPPAQPTPAAPFAQQQPYTQPYVPQPYYQPQNIMPNIYNPANQPLSPYLNLQRNNPAVNYYFGVRPGTSGGFGFGLGAPFTAQGGNRPLFFPQLANTPDPLLSREPGLGDVLPPAGHPVVFNNTLGFFPSATGSGGNTRNGLSGLGNSGRSVTGR
jgi:hypothetical protein